MGNSKEEFPCTDCICLPICKYRINQVKEYKQKNNLITNLVVYRYLVKHCLLLIKYWAKKGGYDAVQDISKFYGIN